MICLDDVGNVVRPAMLWNDPRPARAAADLVAEWGAGEEGRWEWIRAVGLVPQPFHTVARLRWLAEHETTNSRTGALRQGRSIRPSTLRRCMQPLCAMERN
jgi:xylulokinase